jgi:hypothetical protein
MIVWCVRRPVFSMRLAVAGVLAAGEGGYAACFDQQQVLPAQSIADFKANVAGLLQRYPNGGAELISRIRDLAASDSATLPLILGLISNVNGDQLNAIGTGLGQAALVCIRTDQAYSTEIQQAVAATNNSPLTLAFTAVLGDRPIGGLGGGGGGGDGGGPTNAFAAGRGFYPPGTFPGTTTPNSGPGSLTLSAAGGGGIGSTTTITGPVSPTQ